MSRRPDLEQLADLVAERLDGQRPKVRDLGPLVARVAGFLLVNPDTPPSLVAAQVVGRKQDVLRAVRDIRNAAQTFLEARNQVSDTSSREASA